MGVCPGERDRATIRIPNLLVSQRQRGFLGRGTFSAKPKQSGVNWNGLVTLAGVGVGFSKLHLQ